MILRDASSKSHLAVQSIRSVAQEHVRAAPQCFQPQRFRQQQKLAEIAGRVLVLLHPGVQSAGAVERGNALQRVTEEVVSRKRRKPET